MHSRTCQKCSFWKLFGLFPSSIPPAPHQALSISFDIPLEPEEEDSPIFSTLFLGKHFWFSFVVIDILIMCDCLMRVYFSWHLENKGQRVLFVPQGPWGSTGCLFCPTSNATLPIGVGGSWMLHFWKHWELVIYKSGRDWYELRLRFTHLPPHRTAIVCPSNMKTRNGCVEQSWA